MIYFQSCLPGWYRFSKIQCKRWQ